jgi:SAM-dependent methyltransferase
MSHKPLNAARFLEAARAQIAGLEGTHIHQAISADYLAKTGHEGGGYVEWLEALVPYLVERYRLPARPKLLDFGCGTGELTVLLNSLGFATVGVDVHEEHLRLARILGADNGLPDETFVLGGDVLPFPDAAFDIVNLHVVVEHLSDEVLARVLPELHRVCRGVLYVVVPNRLQMTDDHTGLRFINWLPRPAALAYIRLRGARYAISRDGSWDVWYRGYRRIKELFARHDFALELPDDALVFPRSSAHVLFRDHFAQARSWRKLAWIAPKLVVDYLIARGTPPQAFYPHLNLIFVRRP